MMMTTKYFPFFRVQDITKTPTRSRASVLIFGSVGILFLLVFIPVMFEVLVTFQGLRQADMQQETLELDAGEATAGETTAAEETLIN